MTNDYYARSVALHVDGTPIFKSVEDERNEANVAAIIAQKWRCELFSFGRLSPIDWWAQRDGRIVGVLELKSRSHAVDRYDTVFLNVRKWLALQLAQAGLGVPSVFVVKFTDDIRFVPLSTVSPTVSIGGCTRIVKSRNDIEPVIEVPVRDLRPL